MADRESHAHLLRVLLCAWPRTSAARRDAARESIAVARAQAAAGDYFLAADSLWRAVHAVRGVC